MILNRIINKTIFVFFLSAFILFFAACGQKTKIKGSEFIPQDVLVQVLSDIHLIDGITTDMKYYRKFNPGDSIDLYSAIFEKYNVDKEMYERTIKEYSKYPQLLNKVYDEVLMNLNLLQDKVEKEEEDRQVYGPIKKNDQSL